VTDIIKNLGLCEAIDTISRDLMQVNPVKIYRSLETFSEDSVGDKFKLNVFRMVQEQLNNIVKHAKATQVRISLVQTKNFIALSISELADPWVISHAMDMRATVVTKENVESAMNSKRIRIPNVCKNMGVSVLMIFEFVKEIGLKFSCKI
jgi:signal transduction histidine kinase